MEFAWRYNEAFCRGWVILIIEALWYKIMVRTLNELMLFWATKYSVIVSIYLVYCFRMLIIYAFRVQLNYFCFFWDHHHQPKWLLDMTTFCTGFYDVCPWSFSFNGKENSLQLWAVFSLFFLWYIILLLWNIEYEVVLESYS